MENAPQHKESWESLKESARELKDLRLEVLRKAQEVFGKTEGLKWFSADDREFLDKVRWEVPGDVKTYAAWHALIGSSLTEEFDAHPLNASITKKDFPGKSSLEDHYKGLLKKLDEEAAKA